MCTEAWAAIASAAGTIVSAVYIGRDYRAKYRKRSARYVKVPNPNIGGYEDFSTNLGFMSASNKADKIEICADGSVEITRLAGLEVYRSYFNWRS